MVGFKTHLVADIVNSKDASLIIVNICINMQKHLA